MLNIESSNLPQKALSIREAADYLGISERSLHRIKNRGKIKFSRIGKRVVFRLRVLDQFLERNEVDS